MILSERPNDADSQDGFTKWPFMTTHTWAEYPRGRWSLEIEFVKGAPQEGFVKVAQKYFLKNRFSHKMITGMDAASARNKGGALHKPSSHRPPFQACGR